MRTGRGLSILVPLLAAGFAFAASASTPTRSELRLAGLKIDDPLALVHKNLGQPQRVIGAPGSGHAILLYPGLRIEMTRSGRVLMLKSTSSRYCTPSGVCPGKPFAEVRKRWGEGTTDEDAQGRGKISYDDIGGSSCFVEVEPDTSGRFVHSVGFACP